MHQQNSASKIRLSTNLGATFKVPQSNDHCISEDFENSQGGFFEQSVLPVVIQKMNGHFLDDVPDILAVEEPLEIRIGYDRSGKRNNKNISITMRTPGNDFELAAGFLFTEGLVESKNDIDSIQHCGPIIQEAKSRNVIRVELNPLVHIDLQKLERHFYTTSSCGVCGKSSIEALKVQNMYSSRNPTNSRSTYFHADVIRKLPQIMNESQAVFEKTGGLHAAAVFNPDGELVLLREDVGRHNAMDKVIGAALLNGQIPLRSFLVMVSGRASFELLQKASMAGIPVLAAVGAPSSLAVELAREFNMTLLGFVRDSGFNIYTGEWRILS